MHYNLIVAYDKKRGIGYTNSNNLIQWNIKKNMNHLKTIISTTKNTDSDGIYHYINAVIMGHKTWELFLTTNLKPLNNRLNIILTRETKESSDWVYFINGFDEIEDVVNNFNRKRIKTLNNETNDTNGDTIYRIDQLFVIGGADIYKQTLTKYQLDKIYLTEIYHDFNCNIFFPKFDVYKHRNVNYSQKVSERIKYIQYNNYDFTNQFVLLKVSEIDEEDGIYYRFLEYQSYKFLQPSTSLYFNNQEEEYLSNLLKIIDQGEYTVNKMNGETYNLFGERIIFDLKKGFPILAYKNDNFRYIFDEVMFYCKVLNNHQIKNIIQQLKDNPTSPQITINLYQFNVNLEKKELNCQINLMEADFLISNKWCHVALLIHLLCNLKCLDLSIGKLIIIIGNTYVKKSNIDEIKQILETRPQPYPKLIIKEKKNNIEDFNFIDLDLIGF